MEGNMERVLSIEAEHKFPKKFVLLVNMKKEPGRHCSSGQVYWVADSKDEIHAKRRNLGDEQGKTMVVWGFDDAPQIGGLQW